MADVSRRTMLAVAAAGALGAGGMARAQAAGEDPHSVGTVADGKVELPPLHADTEVNGALPNPEPPARRLGIAVVGLGHLSLEQILPAFGQAQAVRLVALVSGHRDKALALAAQHGVPERSVYDYAGFDRIRDDPGIEAVYVVLPNAMHMEFTVRAAQAGKHVLCEKPMATTVEDAERMVKACADAKVRLMIAYRMQYEPTHRAAIRMLRAGELGRLRLIEAVNGQNDAPGQWRQVKAMAGGGSLPDVGLYCLNAFRYLTGEEPVEVTGRFSSLPDDPRFREVEDLATFTLQFPSGVLGVGTSGYSIHESRTLRVMADRAALQFENAFAYGNLAMSVARKTGAVEGVERRQYPARSQFATEMDHFAQAIRAGVVPHTPGEEGVQDMRVMAAIARSAASGGAAVRLPPVAGLDATRGPAPREG